VSATRPIKIAIVGGGCASIAAAFELSRPEHQGRYQITIYQLGWRLGGKGASGRGPAGRIEEHGLHVWLGFYDNAFRLLRQCYEELASSPGAPAFGSWRDVFMPENNVGLFAPTEREGWQDWAACFPPRPGLPGDPVAGSELFSLPYYLGRAIGLLQTLLLNLEVRSGMFQADRAKLGDALGFDELEPPGDTTRLISAITRLISGGVFGTAAAIAQGLGLLKVALTLVPTQLDSLARLAERVGDGLRRWLEDRLVADHSPRHLWEVVDLVIAIVVGSLRFGLPWHPRGLEAIDDYECREWLELNGASERSIQSPLVCGLYDLALAYERGDANRPGLAAGQALRGSLRMFFGYRGALFWRMRAGMGDVVFAPFYEVLRRRGVTFAFFHRLTKVGLAKPDALTPGEDPYIATLDFDVQAEVKAGRAYAPLVEIGGRPCWPSSPDYAQLENGATLAGAACDFESHWDRRRVGVRTLEVGMDFDFVVLGTSVGVVPEVCREILARDGRWRAMVAQVKTVATQTFQIWLKRDLQDLGWTGPPFLVSAFVKPFDTWCDMAHVIPEESWRVPPRTAVYFCGVLPDPPADPEDDDPGYPTARTEEVRRSAVAFLRDKMRPVWPLAFDAAGEFRWDLLADATSPEAEAKEAGPMRFATQYWHANVNPSDRYVLALPGSLRYRISPLDRTYDNLTIAGDWTDCGFNEGCVEAAVMSGRLAAHALSGAPTLEEITAYDHP